MILLIPLAEGQLGTLWHVLVGFGDFVAASSKSIFSAEVRTAMEGVVALRAQSNQIFHRVVPKLPA